LILIGHRARDPPTAMNTTASRSTPILAIEGARATIRLNRPAEHNRLDPADLNTLRSQLQRIDSDEGIRVLVLTGTGTRSFCSGYTISALQGMDSRPAPEDPTLEQVINRVENLRVPVICSLNGSVYGGGIDLALACDFRIGVTGTRIVMPAAGIGLHYYAGGLRRYVERLGLAASKRLFLIGEPMQCDEMLRVGFLDELVEPAALQGRTDALARIVEGNAPAALAGMKRHLNLISQGKYEPAAITADHQRSLRSADLAEGLAALKAKRAPKFQGK
jgi:enoyl-CoA hydratase/carnithine racemase